MVEIKINESFAQITEGEWRSSDKNLLRMIKAQMPFFEREFIDYSPDLDYSKAEYIAEKFGGEVTVYEPIESDAPENAVF